MSNDKYTARIQKLMNQAENAGSEAEAQTFFEKAISLSEDYNISLAVARAYMSEEERSKVLVREKFEIGKVGSRGLRARASWAAQVAMIYGCKVDLNSRGAYIIIFGTQSQVDLVKTVITHLTIQLEQFRRQAQKAFDRTYGDRFSAHSFDIGFFGRTQLRIADLVSEERESAVTVETVNRIKAEDSGKNDSVPSSVAIAIRERDLEVADFHSKNSNARGSFNSGSGATNGASYRSGGAAGERASFGGQKAVGYSRAIA